MSNGDILDRVDLTPAAVDAYRAFTQQLGAVLTEMEFPPGSTIPEEQAYEDKDGNLVIYVDLPAKKGRVEFFIPPSQWAWQDRN